jgi:hypothetical protein
VATPAGTRREARRGRGPRRPPRDRWHGAPPLAANGRITQRAHYDLSVSGAAIGQERLVVAEHADKRTVAGEIADFGNEMETAYQVAGDRATITTTVTGELVVDVTGGIVEQTFGPPADTRASRR